MLNFSTTVTILGFSFEGTDISITSDGEQLISNRLAVGDVFQVKVQYDIEIGGPSGKSTTASAQQQQPNPAMPSFATSNTGGAIQPGGGGCCVIL
jgi:hypothetical protein